LESPGVQKVCPCPCSTCSNYSTLGEEDGVDKSGVKADELYTKPEQVFKVFKALSAIGPMFSIAAAFGNVHGVYKPGNVVLSPHLLGGHQKYIKEQIKSSHDKPAFLVMHGGSGSSKAEIQEAVSHGVIKMNIDTDTQWAYWDGLLQFYKKNEGYLQGQVGNPEGEDKPNKKYFDPRFVLKVSAGSNRFSIDFKQGLAASIRDCLDQEGSRVLQVPQCRECPWGQMGRNGLSEDLQKSLINSR
jgi:fructose-bisphosphate aldolase class II